VVFSAQNIPSENQHLMITSEIGEFTKNLPHGQHLVASTNPHITVSAQYDTVDIWCRSQYQH